MICILDDFKKIILLHMTFQLQLHVVFENTDMVSLDMQLSIKMH